jgi:hypothetical protein
MLKTATSLSVIALLALPAALQADTPSLMTKRANSCGGSAFEQTFAEGKHDGYRHRRFQVLGATYVGDAVLEWCQSAQNAVIYFYVDDPAREDHEACPEAMSLAVFPGRGADVPQILKDNMLSYDNSQVVLVEAPKVEPIRLTAGDRTIEALQLSGVVIDSAGRPTRKKMIGYDKDGDFVRVMTGVVEGKGCKNDVTANFMTALKWP